MKKRSIHLLLLILLSFCSWGSLHATIRYVKQGGAGDGSSWTNASGDLQAMINASGAGDQVWVAAGTYKPTSGSNRTISFVMKNGVAIYGGFPNTGNPGLGNRNWATHVTTLSGNIGTISFADNSYHVINNSGLNNTAVLDGFTVSGGNGNGLNYQEDGGGMFNTYSSPTVTNCIFSANSANHQGGGMYNGTSAPKVTNCSFSGNSALFGGGMMNEEESAPQLTNCSFSSNSALFGGGIFNEEESAPQLTNCSFSGNSAAYGGGGIYNSSSSPTVINCSFSGNYETTGGGGMYNEDSSPTVTNSILWGNSSGIDGDGTVKYSIVQGGYAGTGNLDMDPLFVGAGDLRLQTCSPAINTGSNAAVPSGVTTDLDGNPRFFNSGVVDMGAYEFQGNPTPVVAACQGQTVTLNSMNAATLAASALDNGSTGCGTLSFTVGGQSSMNFTCANIGSQQYTLTVTDTRGQMATCMATVTVQGNTLPTITCPATQILVLGANCTAALPNYTSLATTNDNCGVQSVTQSPAAGTSVSGAGDMTVTLTTTDVNNNSSECQLIVTKVDNTAPTVQCFPQTLTFNGETQFVLNADDLVDAADHCGVASIAFSPPAITCAQLGQVVTVTATVADINGNESTCTSQVTVTGLPCGWSQNPGGVNCANGSSIAYNSVNGVWTATSTNCYSSNFNSDAAAFAQRTLCGDGSITAQVTGINGDGWAGIVMRESNAPGARKAQLMTNLGNLSRREFRTTINGAANPQQFSCNQRYWLRIVRMGNQFIMYVSPNSAAWYLVASQTIAMPGCIQMGLVATNYTANSTVTATFANVNISGGVSPLTVSPDTPTAVAVYPNPTTGEVNIDLRAYAGRAVRLEVCNLFGQVMHYVDIDEVQHEPVHLDLSGYAKGAYLIRIITDGAPAVTKLLNIQ
ncbi:MAG: T9SS type A sorting domain-containing protein [Saprospiraceae bacterium]|nr:T9SS type A sorting domain-containing protein [Saprospiraceae bacterium]